MSKNSFQTHLGQVEILDKKGIFEYTLNLFRDLVNHQRHSIALTGGSTPKAFYQWLAENKPENNEFFSSFLWTTSDERWVPLNSEESNFGIADRSFLEAFGVPENRKLPWPVSMTDPHKAAAAYEENWRRLNPNNATTGYDLCLLGMGDDCHTASLFPDSPLLKNEPESNFAAVEVPAKGMRLTVTPQGLANSDKIVITVTGKGKTAALKEVFQGEKDEQKKPVQILERFKNKVTWLIDPDAAADLFA